VIEASILSAIADRLGRELALAEARYLPFRVDATIVGWLDQARAQALARFEDVFAVSTSGVEVLPNLNSVAARSEALEAVSRALADAGQLSRWRDERYAVASRFGEPPLLLLERAAARYFGIATYAAHINGLTRRDNATAMWLARRSPGKPIDPGMLDNLVGGGIAAGATVAETVAKEAYEEAGIPPHLARGAKPAGRLRICRAQPDGLQRETIFVHDLELPAEFRACNHDGEVVEHRLVSPVTAARLVANREGVDVVTADASLVILDWLLRTGEIPRDSRHHATLAALRNPPASPLAPPA
jgi:8-oxo-dGTP pyrophosphatase MutT (NUDIX family)